MGQSSEETYLISGLVLSTWVFWGFCGLCLLGTFLIFYGASMGETWNPWLISIEPPDLEVGLAFAPLDGWYLAACCNLCSWCFSWALRQVEFQENWEWFPRSSCFSFAILAYTTLVVIRPVLMVLGGMLSPMEFGHT